MHFLLGWAQVELEDVLHFHSSEFWSRFPIPETCCCTLDGPAEFRVTFVLGSSGTLLYQLTSFSWKLPTTLSMLLLWLLLLLLLGHILQLWKLTINCVIVRNFFTFKITLDYLCNLDSTGKEFSVCDVDFNTLQNTVHFTCSASALSCTGATVSMETAQVVLDLYQTFQ